jgi:preprotein translocase SecE subunit
MADKKKNTSRPASQTATRATLKTNEKDQPVKSISAMARDEAKNAKEQTDVESTSSVKSISAMARDERKSVKEQTKPESKPSVKTSTAALRSESRKDRPAQDSKAKRDSKEPAWLLRFRNSRVGRFVFDAYYELRHKVTWPTFEEARNMTIIVIVLSAIIGAALALVDFGLYHLFLLISGG